MEISLSNVVKGTLTSGIVPLSIDEIEMVSGGKSVIATWWEAIVGFFSGGSAPTPPSGGVPMTGGELAQMLSDCVAAGGSFSVRSTTEYGGGSFIFTNASGESTSLQITCTRP